jgi:hypothetical protein
MPQAQLASQQRYWAEKSGPSIGTAAGYIGVYNYKNKRLQVHYTV